MQNSSMNTDHFTRHLSVQTALSRATFQTPVTLNIIQSLAQCNIWLLA